MDTMTTSNRIILHVSRQLKWLIWLIFISIAFFIWFLVKPIIFVTFITLFGFIYYFAFSPIEFIFNDSTVDIGTRSFKKKLSYHSISDLKFNYYVTSHSSEYSFVLISIDKDIYWNNKFDFKTNLEVYKLLINKTLKTNSQVQTLEIDKKNPWLDAIIFQYHFDGLLDLKINGLYPF